MKTKLLFFLMLLLFVAMKSDKSAYEIYNAKGKETDYSKMLNDAKNADIILFGELHNNPICHWLQYELTKDVHKVVKSNLVLGAEMFEADNQILLDEYTSQKISGKNFESQARLWNNYKTDYRPLVDLANKNKLKFVASNIPRRYASIVSKKGFEGLDELSDEAKKYIAPLPIKYSPELPCYKKMLSMSAMMGKKPNLNFPKAQAIKDATMAYFILKNWEKGLTFLHFNGTYHSNDYEGIVWYLKQENPDLIILTIASVQQKDIEKLDDDSKNLADYIICIPESMTGTY